MHRNFFKAGLLTSLVAMALIIGFGCDSGGGGGGGKTTTRKVVPANNVVVMDDRPTLLLADTTEGLFTFQRVVPLGAGVVPMEVLPGDTQGISPDQIIVGSDGSGYLRRVTSVSDTGTSIMVGTTAATMEDVFEELDTEHGQILTPDDVESQMALAEGVTLGPLTRKGDAHPPGADPAGLGEFTITVTDVLYTSGGKTVSVSGSIHFKPELVFRAKIKNFKLQSLRAQITLNETVSLSATANVDIAGFKKEKELAVYKMKPITIWAGFVPIVLKPTISLVAGVEGNLYGQITTGVTVVATQTAGLQYYHGAWSPIKSFSLHFTAQPPAATVTANLRAYAGPQLLVRIYGVVGPYITTAGFVEFESTVPGDPLWEVYAGILIKAGAKIKIMGRVLVDYSVDIYNYKILLIDSDRPVQTGDNVSLPEPGGSPPTWPMMVNVVPVSSYQIDLSWDECFDDTRVVSYLILNGDSVQIGTSTVTSFSHKGLTAGKNYCYKVLAVDTDGNESSGHYTWCASTLPLDSAPPSAPAGLAIIADSPNSLWLTWSPSTDNVFVTGYKVLLGTKIAGAVSSANMSVNGLDPTTNYCFTVVALDGEGNMSGPSPEVCQTTLTDVDGVQPSAPGLNAPNVINSSRIDLNWTAATDNVRVAGYLIYANAAQIGSSFTTSFSALHLIPNTNYCFTVKAYDPEGNLSVASNPPQCATTFATTPDGTPPTVPTNPSATPASYDQISVNWSASTDNVSVTGYQVFRNGEYELTTGSPGFLDTGLFPSTQYCYKIKAVDAADNISALSVETCATTQAAP